MNENKYLRCRVLITVFSIIISGSIFAHNVENTDIAELDTISAEIITIGSEGNENPSVQIQDTVTEKTTEIITAPVTVSVAVSSYTPNPDSADFDFIRRLLRDYKFSPIRTRVEYSDTVILPSIQLPFVNYQDRIPDTVSLPEISFSPDIATFEKRLSTVKIFSDRYGRNEIDKNAYQYVLDNHPEYVKYRISEFSDAVEKASEIEANDLKNVFQIEYDLNRDLNKPEKYQPNPKFWLWKGQHYLSFSQSDNSSNWTDTTRSWKEKGLGSMNMISVQAIIGKYKKKRLEINHTVEWRLNIANSMNDSVRSIRIVEDRLRSYTDFGIRAINHWNYSTSLEITTPLLNNYRENSDTLLVSSFLSPLKLTYGLGMKYQHSRDFPKILGRKVTFVADINPLALQYIYIHAKLEADRPKQYGIIEPKGVQRLSQVDFGSTVTSTLKVNFNKYVTLDSRLKYFTNYHKSYCEFENTMNMPVNRYLSMRLYAYLTFDDSRVRDPQFGYFSLNETLGLTFNVTW